MRARAAVVDVGRKGNFIATFMVQIAGFLCLPHLVYSLFLCLNFFHYPHSLFFFFLLCKLLALLGAHLVLFLMFFKATHSAVRISQLCVF